MLGSSSVSDTARSPAAKIEKLLLSQTIRKKLTELFIDYAAVFSQWSEQDERGDYLVSDKEIGRALNELRTILGHQENSSFGIKVHDKRSGLFVSVTLNGTSEAFAAQMLGSKDDIIIGNPDEVRLLSGSELRRIKFDEFLEESHSTLNEWKNGKSSLKQQQFLQLLRDVLSYSREDKLALQVFPYQEGKRLEVTLRDRLVALIQIAGPKTLYFREFRESAPNLTPGKYDHPSYSVLTRTTKPLEENLALWAETFEPQLVFFATTRLDEELDEYTRETLLQELLSALHCSEDSSVVVEGVLPTLSLEVKEGLRLLSRADIHIVEQRAVVSYHSNIQKYPLPCSDRKKDSLRKEIAFPEASIPKRSTLLFEKLAPIFKQEAETLMLWAVPDEGARPSDEKRAAVKRCLQEALGLPEDRFVELVVQNGEPFVLALWASGKPLLEIVMDFEASGWKLLWLNDYRESDLIIDPKKVSAIPFREAGKLEKVMTNTAEFINEQALFFHAACQSIHTAKLPEESRTLLERALMSCLGVSKDGHMYISKVGRSFHIIATQGLELVAELKYAPGADTIEWCYHRAFIREKRPAPEEYLIPVRRPIRPKTLVQVIEDPEGTEEPESPSKWQLTFSDSKLDSFSMMNPAPHLGGAVIEVQIDEPTRINHERSAVCLRTILSNGAVNDCARVEIAEDGKLLGIFFEMLDQDPTQSYRFDFE